MSQEEFEEFLRMRQQAREQKERHLSRRALGSCLEFSMPVPQLDDHSMDRYVEKIRAAIDKASGH